MGVEGLTVELGIHNDISAADYHADKLLVGPTLSRSCAATLIGRSPFHAKSEHPRMGNLAKPSNNEMDFGDICHQLFLGKGSGMAIFEGKTWQGKEAGAFWDSAVAKGETPIKRADHSRALMAVSEWRRQLHDMNLDYAFGAEGQTEVTAIWNEGENCNARARFDWLVVYPQERQYEIWDLKTTENASPAKADKAIGNMGYDLQECFYSRGFWNCRPEFAGRGKFYFLFAETVAPFAILPYQSDGIYRGLGEQKTQEAIMLWSECMKSGKWPSYSTGIHRGECPKWMSPTKDL